MTTLAAFSATVQAQAPNPADLIPPSYLPKSPTAAGMARFDTQQLVNLPTGAAQLSVALGEVKCGALQLPVSLGYSYTGLQVGQPYDLVGLGWALQAGSTITRQVNGLIDDEVAGNSVRRYRPDSLLNPTQSYLKRVSQNDVDTGPDVYSFALPNGSAGRFVIRDTTAMLLPRQPLQVRHLGNRNTLGYPGFQVTTEDGIRYQFWARELTRPNPNNFGPVGIHATAWQLTHVISADNRDTLRLHYTSGGLEALPQQATLTTGSYFTGRFLEEGNVGNLGEDCGSRSDYSFHNVWMFPSHMQAQYLDSITGRGVHLQLIRAANHQVQRVRLVATTNGRREIRRWQFFQSTFAGGTAADYRLRLDSLQESAGELRLPAYRFQYFNDVPMPSRGSAAKDYWGYYNGATSNGSNTSTASPTLLDDPHLADCGKLRANRRPNYGSAKAGALLKVVYPTGGTSQWEYEPGRISTEDAPVPLSEFDVEVGTGYERSKEQLYDGKFLTLSDKAVFQVPEEVDVAVMLDRTPTGTLAGGGNNTYRDFNIWRRLPTRDTLITNETGLNKYKCFDPNERAYFTFHLVPGTYVAQVYCERREIGTGIVITVPFHDSTRVNDGLPGPGMRVRRTTTTAPGAPPLVHTYTYALRRNSSGVSLLPENGTGFEEYGYTKHFWTSNSTWLRSTTCHFINTSSDNRGLGSEFNKYDFYYNAVKDEIGTGQGTTLHQFTHLAQQFNDVVPTGKSLYRQDPQRPQRLQLAEQTRYTYATDSTVSFPLIRVQEAKVYHGNGTPVPPTVYGYQLYEVRAGFAAPELTEQYQYDENGKALVTLTRATYQKQRLVRSATRTSLGWTIQRYKYLTDYVGSATVRSLRGPGFNPVVETQTWRRPGPGVDSVLVGGQLTFFDAARRAPAGAWTLRLPRPVLQPNAEAQLNGRFTGFKSDTRYHLDDSVCYDLATGLLLQRQPPKAPPTAYVWGYNRSQVVAQIENATYASVAAVLSPATIALLQSASPGSDAQVRQLLAPLRTQLPQARVTIYTHAPLVGLTSQTDPSGRTSYYEYDDLGRLLRVRDEQGRILSEQEYHYARPN